MSEDLPFSTSPTPGTYPYRFTQDDRFQARVKVQPAGDCLEVVVRWSDTRRAADADYRKWAGIPRGPRIEKERSEQERQDNIRAAAERSHRMVRLLCIELRADRLLTFTTRWNDDTRFTFDQTAVAWERYVRMAKVVDPSFRYLAVPEPHPSNPEHFHVHVAVRGWINIRLHDRMWNAALASVIGRRAGAGKNTLGNVDVDYRSKHKDAYKVRGITKSIKIASYIAKYITKDLIQRFNKKRYWHTKGIKVQEPTRAWLESDNLEDALREVEARYGFSVDQHTLGRVWRPGNLVFFRVDTGRLEPPF